MKLLSLSIVLVGMLVACNSAGIVTPLDANAQKNASGLVGKWNPTYLQKSKDPSAQWTTINTLVALPTIEFTADGKFLSDGKPGADCCGFVGNSYTLKDNKIIFADFKTCPEVSCIAVVCDGWKVESIANDTLTVESCFSTNKYVRAK